MSEISGRPWKRKGAKSWTAIITKGTKADGSPDKIWQSGFPTRAAANTYIVDKLYELQHGTYVDPSKITVGEWLDIWLRDYYKASPKTTEGRESDIRLHLKPALGTVPLQKLTTEHVQRAYNLWGDLSHPNTVRARAQTLKLALRQAMRCGHLNRMATEGAVLPSFKKAKVESLTEDEMNQMIRGFEGHEMYALVVMGFASGMRRGELLGLRWSSIKGNKIEIADTVSQTNEGTTLREGKVKTESSHRTIEIPEATMAILREHKRKTAERRLQVGKDWEDNDLVFPGAYGQARNLSGASSVYARQAVKIGFTGAKAHMHTMRHTHASLLFAHGATVKMVQERLGHANSKVTADIYLHTLPGQDALAAQTIGGLMDCMVAEHYGCRVVAESNSD